MPDPLSLNQQEAALSSICKVVGQIPCYHIYEEHVEKLFAQNQVSLRAIMHNATLDSALVNVRSFNEFFKPGGRKDDIRLRQFTEQEVKPFLTIEDEEDINKYLAHITIPRLGIVTKPWFIDRLVGLSLSRADELFRVSLETFPFKRLEIRAEVEGVRKGIQLVLKKIHALNAETPPPT